jgi:hypothetical protein
MSMDVLVDSFPLQLRDGSVEIVEEVTPEHAKPGERWLTVRLILFDYSGSITDIKEQWVRIARDAQALEHEERVRNCLAAHRELLGQLFEMRHEDLPTLLPSELLFFDELLALERAFTVDDFARALLAKSRLGLLVRR